MGEQKNFNITRILKMPYFQIYYVVENGSYIKVNSIIKNCNIT